MQLEQPARVRQLGVFPDRYNRPELVVDEGCVPAWNQSDLSLHSRAAGEVIHKAGDLLHRWGFDGTRPVGHEELRDAFKARVHYAHWGVTTPLAEITIGTLNLIRACDGCERIDRHTQIRLPSLLKIIEDHPSLSAAEPGKSYLRNFGCVLLEAGELLQGTELHRDHARMINMGLQEQRRLADLLEQRSATVKAVNALSAIRRWVPTITF